MINSVETYLGSNNRRSLYRVSLPWTRTLRELHKPIPAITYESRENVCSHLPTKVSNFTTILHRHGWCTNHHGKSLDARWSSVMNQPWKCVSRTWITHKSVYFLRSIFWHIGKKERGSKPSLQFDTKFWYHEELLIMTAWQANDSGKLRDEYKRHLWLELSRWKGLTLQTHHVCPPVRMMLSFHAVCRLLCTRCNDLIPAKRQREKPSKENL